MNHSISSPGSSSFFHIGTSVPFFYQDFICRYEKLRGDGDYKQVIALNAAGLRTFNKADYLEHIKLMELSWDGEVICDVERQTQLHIKNLIVDLIEKGAINREKYEIFTCKNHSQIYLTPGDNWAIKLVKVDNELIPRFKSSELGYIYCPGVDQGLIPSFIGITNSKLKILNTPFGELPVKEIPGITYPMLFFESDSVKKVEVKSDNSTKIELEFDSQRVYKCTFCDEILIPTSHDGWIIDYEQEVDISHIKGVVPRKHWETLLSEICRRQIISRERMQGTGISTIDLSQSIGISGMVIDPEFCIQFLPIIQANNEGTAVDSLFISMMNQKYVINSARLSNLFNNRSIENIYVLGVLRGMDNQIMRKSNNNVIELKSIIELYGIDSVRFYIAKTNLLEKASRIFEYSTLIYYKRFVERLQLKFVKGRVVEKIDIHDDFENLSQNFEINMGKRNFLRAVNELEKFFSRLSGDIPTDRKDLNNLYTSLSYLECLAPTLAQHIRETIDKRVKQKLNN